MLRDPALETVLRHDPAGLTGKPMSGGYAFPLHGHMIGAARVGRAFQPDALDLPGTESMIQNCGLAMPGYVWPSGPPLADSAIRRPRPGMAPDHAAILPTKSKEPAGC